MTRLSRMSSRSCALALALLGLLAWTAGSRRFEPVVRADSPASASLWLVPPDAVDGGKSALSSAVADLDDGKAARALPTLERAAKGEHLHGYALLYLGRAQLALAKTAAAQATADELRALHPGGALDEASLWLSAQAAEAATDWPAAQGFLQTLLASNPADAAQAELRLGQDALAAHDRVGATQAFEAVYYEHPLSDEALEAAKALPTLHEPDAPRTPEELRRALGRAQALFGAKRYKEARAAFAAVRAAVAGDDRSLADLRIGACDVFLKHYAEARRELRPLLERDSPYRVQAEVLDFGLLRAEGHGDEYVSRARAFVEAHPADPLAEQTLDELGTYYIVNDLDAQAAATFADLYARFPSGPDAARAAWHAGWWAYKSGAYDDAVRDFESAAAAFPHDNYRSAWLYWDARALAHLDRRAAAVAAYRQVIHDYRNWYYGRAAIHALAPLVASANPARAVRISPARETLPVSIQPGQVPPDAPMIRSLLAAGLFDDAAAEVRYAQRAYGASPLLGATLAFALNRSGLLRPAITAMRGAYPQFMAEGGEALPDQIRRIIFPLDYWDLIEKYSSAHDLDPYLMAALIAQESTFQADVRSSANAWGLMQIVPVTGRRYASKLRIRPFSTWRLTRPDVNVRIGMATFADLFGKFGSVAAALAAYNAGDSRVAAWIAERPGFAPDEFIDDIPFPETKNYVKRILGTAEDYRMLYGGPEVVRASETAAR